MRCLINGPGLTPGIHRHRGATGLAASIAHPLPLATLGELEVKSAQDGVLSAVGLKHTSHVSQACKSQATHGLRPILLGLVEVGHLDLGENKDSKSHDAPAHCSSRSKLPHLQSCCIRT